jgi:hypothetical protein
MVEGASIAGAVMAEVGVRGAETEAAAASDVGLTTGAAGGAIALAALAALSARA